MGALNSTVLFWLPLSAGLAPQIDALENVKVETEFGFVEVDPSDVVLATSEGEAAQRSATEVFRLERVTFAIVEEGSTDASWGGIQDGLVTYTWTFPHGSRRLEPRPAVSVLRHEIAHDLFARHLLSSSGEHGYGTAAPDWLDEMAATAFETPSQRQARARSIDGGSLIPLPDLLRMAHPESIVQATVEAGRTFTTMPPSSDQTIPFYTTVSALYDFLVEKTGRKSIVADAADAFQRGDDLEQWLPGLIGYSHGGENLEVLDADFRLWFSRAYPPDEPVPS